MPHRSYRPNANEDGDVLATEADDSLEVVRVYRHSKPPLPAYLDEDSCEQDRMRFKFDHVFRKSCTQSSIYTACCGPFVRQLFAGYDGTILAYGQTGAGKTYTMVGEVYGQFDRKGLATRIITEACREAGLRRHQGFEVTLRMSALEIYTERLRDLLVEHGSVRRDRIRTASGGRAGADLSIVADENGSPCVPGLSMLEIDSEARALELLMSAHRNQQTAAHGLNQQSSRSHCLYTLYLTLSPSVGGPRTSLPSEQSLPAALTAKLHLVDLAGSERIYRTDSRGLLLKEAGYINRSLSILEQVVRALAQRPRREHVPYRSSKLTHLLKDSLGGKCQTLLLACIWPVPEHIEQTLSTLRFASRMMAVKCMPNVNRVRLGRPSIGYVQQLEQQVRQLQHELREQTAAPDSGRLCDHGKAVFSNDSMGRSNFCLLPRVSSRSAEGADTVCPCCHPSPEHNISHIQDAALQLGRPTAGAPHLCRKSMIFEQLWKLIWQSCEGCSHRVTKLLAEHVQQKDPLTCQDTAACVCHARKVGTRPHQKLVRQLHNSLQATPVASVRYLPTSAVGLIPREQAQHRTHHVSIQIKDRKYLASLPAADYRETCTMRRHRRVSPRPSGTQAPHIPDTQQHSTSSEAFCDVSAKHARCEVMGPEEVSRCKGTAQRGSAPSSSPLAAPLYASISSRSNSRPKKDTSQKEQEPTQQGAEERRVSCLDGLPSPAALRDRSGQIFGQSWGKPSVTDCKKPISHATEPMNRQCTQEQYSPAKEECRNSSNEKLESQQQQSKNVYDEHEELADMTNVHMHTGERSLSKEVERMNATERDDWQMCAASGCPRKCAKASADVHKYLGDTSFGRSESSQTERGGLDANQQAAFATFRRCREGLPYVRALRHIKAKQRKLQSCIQATEASRHVDNSKTGDIDGVPKDYPEVSECGSPLLQLKKRAHRLEGQKSHAISDLVRAFQTWYSAPSTHSPSDSNTSSKNATLGLPPSLSASPLSTPPITLRGVPSQGSAAPLVLTDSHGVATCLPFLPLHACPSQHAYFSARCDAAGRPERATRKHNRDQRDLSWALKLN